MKNDTMKSKCSFDCRELPPCDKCKMVGCVHAPEKSPQEKLIDSRMNDILENAKQANIAPVFQSHPDWLAKKLEEFREKFVDHLDSDTPVVQVSAGDIESWLSSQFLAIDAAARKETEKRKDREMLETVAIAVEVAEERGRERGAESFKKRAIKAMEKLIIPTELHEKEHDPLCSACEARKNYNDGINNSAEAISSLRLSDKNNEK